MAQNISLWGATYSDVPSVLLPKSGGGTALFADPSGVTATASDVASGKYFIDSSGTLTAGTGSGGGGVVVTTEPDVAGGTIVNIDAVNLAGDTVDAAHLLSGYTAHDSSGAAITGSYTPQDYIVTVTSDGNGGWTCDKTYAQVYSAYSGGKTLIVASANGDVAVHGAQDFENGTYYVSICEYQYDITGIESYHWWSYELTANGFDVSTEYDTYEPIDADAAASDVANGKVFYTSTGRAVGTYAGGMNVQAYTGYASRTANSYGATDVTLTVAKTGTYTVSWCAWRGSSSGTMGTNLHKNNTSGTNQQTWTGTYGQCITLTGQQYTQGDVLTLYATSGSNSRSVYVGNLVIVQTA